MDWLILYAMSFVGRPYSWGGQTPMGGFDCSGITQELLKSAGAHPKPGEDLTAQGLYDALEPNASHNVQIAGSLAFFGASVLKISHVGFMIDSYRMVEAGGGGSAIKTEADAIRAEAFVRIRPLKNRRDLVAVLRPSYSAIGMTR